MGEFSVLQVVYERMHLGLQTHLSHCSTAKDEFRRKETNVGRAKHREHLTLRVC